MWDGGEEPHKTWVSNCLFYGNTATQGGALWTTGYEDSMYSEQRLRMYANANTFVNNAATESGGAIRKTCNEFYGRNLILWGNTPEQLYETCTQPFGDLSITRSDVQGGFAGAGNIDAEPRFLPGPSGTATGLAYDGDAFQSTLTDSGAAWTAGRYVKTVLLVGPEGSAKPYVVAANDAQTLTVWGDATESGAVSAPAAYHVWDWHLAPGSPCIDTGRNLSADANLPVTVDIEGNPRPLDGDGLGAGTTGDGSDYDMGVTEETYIPGHSADTNKDWRISAVEVGRLVSFYNAGGYHIEPATQDGYAPGEGSHEGPAHSADYAPQDWLISATELSRMVAFYNAGGLHPDPATADGFAPDM